MCLPLRVTLHINIIALHPCISMTFYIIFAYTGTYYLVVEVSSVVLEILFFKFHTAALTQVDRWTLVTPTLIKYI